MCCKINTLGFHGTYRIKKGGTSTARLHWPDYEKNDRKVLVPFDDFTIPEKCEMDMLQI